MESGICKQWSAHVLGKQILNKYILFDDLASKVLLLQKWRKISSATNFQLKILKFIFTFSDL